MQWCNSTIEQSTHISTLTSSLLVESDVLHDSFDVINS